MKSDGYAYGGSNPPPPTQAHIAQSVEHILGKNEVIGSSPIVGSSQLEIGSVVLSVEERVVCCVQGRRPGLVGGY